MKHFRNFNFTFWLILTIILGGFVVYGLSSNNPVPTNNSKDLMNKPRGLDSINLSFANGYSQILEGKGQMWATSYLALLSDNEKYISTLQKNDFAKLLTAVKEIESAPTVDSSIRIYKAINYIVFI